GAATPDRGTVSQHLGCGRRRWARWDGCRRPAEQRDEEGLQSPDSPFSLVVVEGFLRPPEPAPPTDPRQELAQQTVGGGGNVTGDTNPAGANPSAPTLRATAARPIRGHRFPRRRELPRLRTQHGTPARRSSQIVFFNARWSLGDDGTDTVVTPSGAYNHACRLRCSNLQPRFTAVLT